ncbi:MAG: VOC family protein, partial [Acidimicrobiales bacterium]
MAVLSKTFFHVAVVVPRLDEALEHLSGVLGAQWGPTTEIGVAVAGPDGGGGRHVPLRFAYSVEPPYFEVIEEAPGSVWVCNPNSNLHHVGYWAEGLIAERDRLVASACPIEIAGFAGEPPEPAMYTYHADPLGIRVELVDAALRPMMEAALAEGRAMV